MSITPAQARAIVRARKTLKTTLTHLSHVPRSEMDGVIPDSIRWIRDALQKLVNEHDAENMPAPADVCDPTWVKPDLSATPPMIQSQTVEG